VSFEGALRGFSGRFGELIGLDDNQFRLREHTVGFCTRGVMSQTAIAEQLVAEGASPAAASSLADYVQLTTNAPVEADPYWTQQDACTFNACQARYGNSDAPLAARDLRIVEAYEGELLIEPRGQSGTPAIKCCFPGVVEFRVRAGNQWVVDGEGVGFLHHVVIDDEGRCRPSCDPNRALMNGRVREAPAGPLADDDPLAFHNPFFRFAINAGASVRDMQFRFSTGGEFTPLTLSIAVNDPDVQPTNARYLPNTGELVVSDGSLEGIVLVDLNALAVTNQHN
jgi:hypothetical protein